MSSLMTSIVENATQVSHVPYTVAMALTALAIRRDGTPKRSPKPAGLDQRTMRDIGYEPGRLTWIG